MPQSWAFMRARAPRHENTHNNQHSSQNRAQPACTVRGQIHVSKHPGALPRVMLVSTPASTTPTRSGHPAQAPVHRGVSCCPPPWLPHTQSQWLSPTPSCTVACALPHAFKFIMWVLQRWPVSESDLILAQHTVQQEGPWGQGHYLASYQLQVSSASPFHPSRHRALLCF